MAVGVEAPMTTMAKTCGETVFEEHLNTLGLRFTYESPIGNRRPDYLIHGRRAHFYRRMTVSLAVKR